LLTGEELFAQYLAKEYTPTTPLSEFEQLLQKAPSLPQSEFEQLLAKPITGSLSSAAQSATEIAIGRTEAGLLSRLIGIVGGPVVAGLQALFYSADAGVANESEIVTQYLNQFGIRAPQSPGTQGQPSDTSGSVPESILAPLLVSASRIAPDLSFDPALGFSPFAIGAGSLAGTLPIVQPSPRGAAGPSPRASPLQQTFPLTATLGLPELGAGTRGMTSPQPAQAPLPTPQTAAQNQPDKCGKQTRQKKKKKPREKCYKGSYVDRKHGLLKYPREEIQCQ
jgi:hypothetical protein